MFPKLNTLNENSDETSSSVNECDEFSTRMLGKPPSQSIEFHKREKKNEKYSNNKKVDDVVKDPDYVSEIESTDSSIVYEVRIEQEPSDNEKQEEAKAHHEPTNEVLAHFKTRKRKRDPAQWARNIKKAKRLF